MDAGTRVAWPERKNSDELSALQHAWNLRIDRGEAAFQAEYQNSPLADDIASDKLDKRSLQARALPAKRGIIPAGHNALTAFVDVQEKLLFWLIASWSESFGGHVVAYGAYPDQAVSFFEAKYAKRTLTTAAKGASQEGAWYAGFEKVAAMILGSEWKREDGMAMRVSHMMIDANYGASTQVVRNFCRQSPFAAQLIPSHGKGIGASRQALSDVGSKHDRVGLQWRLGRVGTATNQKSAIYDTNFWKTFAAARLRMQMGDPEAITLHAGDHELLIEHLTAEFPVRTEAKGRVVDEWQSRPGADNHWWDCLVGAAVAASIAGVNPAASEAGGRQRKKVTIPTNASGKKVIQVKRLK
jgi:phage terminase large subunit GpA-like protein